MTVDWASHMRRILVQLGEDATFTHGSAQASSVKGVYLAPYAVLPGAANMSFEASEPRFAAMTADLGTVSHGDVLARGTVNYTVTESQPDDPSGITVLVLEKS